MPTQITLDIVANELAQANRNVLQAGFKLEEYLNMILRVLCSPRQLQEDAVERIFHLLPNDLVLQLAQAKMAPQKDKAMSRLLERQREGELSKEERRRLHDLMAEYERGTLRKASAMAEAVRRGLMLPLNA